MASTWQLRSTPSDLADRYRADGWWTDDTLGELLHRHLADDTELTFRVWSATRPWQATMGDVFDHARRFAGWLVANDVGPGDVVAFQLPNCAEAAVVFWGAALVGAAVVPIVHFYGPKEVGYILGRLDPPVFVRSSQSPEAPDASTSSRHELVVDLAAPAGDDRALTFVDSLGDVTALEAPLHTDPDAPALIAFTSGTTADPKGVIHTHRSINAEIRQLSHTQPKDNLPNLTGAPVGHAIGMLAGLLMPVLRGDPIHLIDLWDPTAVLAAMVEGELTAGSGSTFFLISLLDAPGFGPEHIARMRYIGLGGSSVPEAVADRAIALGMSVLRAYGSTEHPSITNATHDDPQDKRKRTDGHAAPGVEIRIVDTDGRDLPAGEPGEIWSRGPELCAGYTDPSLTATVFDADGWYHTGDVGVLDADGWLTITDRLSDVIIRGGENISAVEVEGALVSMPGVAEVAVVAAPDARLGEHGCAFIRMMDPAAEGPDLADVREHLAELGMAKQKWPEELRIVADLPRTPSGKIRKNELRAQLS